MALDIPTVEQFRERFPEFEDVSDAAIQAVIDEVAANGVDEGWATGAQRPAIQYLTAHLLTLDQQQIEGGAISSESFGPISVSYARNTTANSLSSTSYGNRYMTLAKQNVGGPRVVTGDGYCV